MRRLFHEHRGFWTARNRQSLYFSIVLIVLAIAVQIGAGRLSYRNALKGNFVGDLLLDRLPVLDLDIIVVQGAMLLWIATTLLCFARPRYLLFGLKAVALFIVIRSFTINLTHLGIYPDHEPLDPAELGYRLYSLFALQGNYFFSGHTGLPFLLALVFWNIRSLRYFFFGVSAFFGWSALLAHVHYSIDVFAAPFFAYGIFKIAEKLFPGDYALLAQEGALTPRGGV